MVQKLTPEKLKLISVLKDLITKIPLLLKKIPQDLENNLEELIIENNQERDKKDKLNPKEKKDNKNLELKSLENNLLLYLLEI